mgnify:CR=1 FL=1
MQGDPLDERRLGFHLGCGWSGVLDLPSQAITHLHAPPQLLGPATGGADDTVLVPEGKRAGQRAPLLASHSALVVVTFLAEARATHMVL